MFALSPLVGWVFFVVGIIWTIGFLKAILKTIRIQAQMNQLRKRACVCSRSILDCKNQWKEEVGVCRNVEINRIWIGSTDYLWISKTDDFTSRKRI